MGYTDSERVPKTGISPEEYPLAFGDTFQQFLQDVLTGGAVGDAGPAGGEPAALDEPVATEMQQTGDIPEDAPAGPTVPTSPVMPGVREGVEVERSAWPLHTGVEPVPDVDVVRPDDSGEGDAVLDGSEYRARAGSNRTAKLRSAVQGRLGKWAADKEARRDAAKAAEAAYAEFYYGAPIAVRNAHVELLHLHYSRKTWGFRTLVTYPSAAEKLQTIHAHGYDIDPETGRLTTLPAQDGTSDRPT